MAITLESVATPGATPILNGSASAKSFANNYYKLVNQNISTIDRLAIAIQGLIYELAAGGGVNYKANHAGLRQDAIVYFHGVSRFDQVVAMTVNDWDNGNSADATLTADVPTLLAQGPKIDRTCEEDLWRMIAFLRQQIGK